MKEFKETLQISENLLKGKDGSSAWFRGGSLSAGGGLVGNGEKNMSFVKFWKITDRVKTLDTDMELKKLLLLYLVTKTF